MPLAELVELVNLWGTRPCAMDGRRPLDGRALTALADELHPVFAATDEATRAQLVTALLDRTGVRPTLTPRDDSGRLIDSWTVDDPNQARRASAALALRHHLSEHPGRIGVCADHQCADVYIDSSPAGRRRFCCVTCQNRARAAAFRRRAKSG
jgi:CGNR zinc finger protein